MLVNQYVSQKYACMDYPTSYVGLYKDKYTCHISIISIYKYNDRIKHKKWKIHIDTHIDTDINAHIDTIDTNIDIDSRY